MDKAKGGQTGMDKGKSMDRMVSARCGCAHLRRANPRRRSKGLFLNVILFVDFAVGERPACFVLAWIASSW